jgi:hypothetical protein
MKTCKTAILVYLFTIVACQVGRSQSAIYSEQTIKFDISTQKTDKPIPFDKSFTLEVAKVPTKQTIQVDIYEAQLRKGKRSLVKNKFECEGQQQEKAVKDITVSFDKSGESLLIFIPPLKPNKQFDINIITTLSADCRAALRIVDTLILRNDTVNASLKYIEFFGCTIDRTFRRTYTEWEFLYKYRPYFNRELLPIYYDLRRHSRYQISHFSLTQAEIQAIGIASDSVINEFKDGKYFIALLNRPRLPAWSMGLFDIRNIYAARPKIDSLDFIKRDAALKSNVLIFDSLLRRIDRIVTFGLDSIVVDTNTVSLIAIRGRVALALSQLRANSDFLNKSIENMDKKIDASNSIRMGTFLAAATVASDLKTEGGNVLFVDLGLTNLIVPGVTGSTVNIPKIYYGVSIYFRPIDKNTRRNKFPRIFDPPRQSGCAVTGSSIKYGPDYGVVTRQSIFQQLSLNIGLTLGSMTNKDFENLYNSNSLLVGPAFRFKRAFKVSGGISLLRRNSRDPLISEKDVVMGSYVSLSVDLDFIQSIKDITSMFTK